ncbi:MAG: prepilin-type N-terminal cleavage/methylation domain-containing protein [bacterium]|nr:prepilin-type N-terminal cleavage/methylation domain-containing protein [bacterium]
MKLTGHRSGFTLLELLVVIGILGVLSSLGAVTFAQMMGRWSDVKHKIDRDRVADNILEGMRKDFSAIISTALVGEDTCLVGFTVDDRDEVVFPVAAPTAQGRTLGGLVRYGLGDDRTLQRVSYKLSDEYDVGEYPVTVAKGVVGMEIEYNAGTEEGWVDHWESPVLPKAVRVSITLADPDNPTRDQVSRWAVFPILVE